MEVCNLTGCHHRRRRRRRRRRRSGPPYMHDNTTSNHNLSGMLTCPGIVVVVVAEIV